MREGRLEIISLQKQYSYYLIWTLSNLLFPLFVFPFIARHLEPQGLGEAQFAIQFSRYFMLLASLGIPIYGVRELAKLTRSETERNLLCANLLSLQLIMAFISSIIYVTVINVWSIQVTSIKLLWLAGIQVFLSWTSIEWILIGLEAFKTIALRTFILRLIASVIMFLLIDSPEDAIWYVCIVVASFVGGNVLLWMYLKKIKIDLTFSTSQITKHFKSIILLSITQLCIIMYTVFDTVWIGLLSTAIAVGLYTTALKLSKIGIVFVTSLGNMLIPKTARTLNMNKSNHNHFRYSFLFVADLSVPMAVGLFLLAPEFIILFSGVAYLPAVKAMRIMAILPVCIGLSNLFGMQILAVAGYDMALFKSVLLGLLIHLFLALILIPFNEQLGAAWAMLGAEFAVLIGTFVAVRKYFAIQFPWSQIVYNALIALIFIPVIWIIRIINLPNWTMLLLGSMICILIYGVFQYWILKQSIVKFTVQRFSNK